MTVALVLGNYSTVIDRRYRSPIFDPFAADSLDMFLWIVLAVPPAAPQIESRIVPVWACRIRRLYCRVTVAISKWSLMIGARSCGFGTKHVRLEYKSKPFVSTLIA